MPPGQSGESLFQAMFAPLWRAQEKRNTERAADLLRRFKLDEKKDDFAGSLSGGQRKLLEMARALMVEPELVMLDEPMAGVNPALKQSLLGHVKSLREDGMTVLFVEHDMDMVRDISDWVIVMAQGRIISEGPPDAVMGDQRVIDAYLGAHHDTELSFEEEETILAEAEKELEAGDRHRTRPPTRSHPWLTRSATSTPRRRGDRAGGRPAGRGLRRDAEARQAHLDHADGAVLRADDLIAGYLPGVNILNGADLYCQPGELVGIIGPNGAGKSTLLKALFGLVKIGIRARSCSTDQDMTNERADVLVSAGIGFVPQTNNVFPSLTIEENLEMGGYQKPKHLQGALRLRRRAVPRAEGPA